MPLFTIGLGDHDGSATGHPRTTAHRHEGEATTIRMTVSHDQQLRRGRTGETLRPWLPQGAPGWVSELVHHRDG